MQICIIGGGVVGLNIALTLAERSPDLQVGSKFTRPKGRNYNEIYLLEQEKFLGHHTSTRNSEVIHVGFAYPPGSLKARLCVEGNILTYALLDKLNVPYKKCGKWVIACGADEDAALAAVEKNADACGVRSFKRSTVSKFLKAEPSAHSVTSVVFSAGSGIMDAAAYIRALEAKLSNHNNVNIIYPCKVTGIDTVKSTVETSRGPMQYDILINSAGLWADDIHNMACRGEDFQMCAGFEIIPFKGEYYTWRKGRVQTMIYPVPRRFIIPTTPVKGRGPNGALRPPLEKGGMGGFENDPTLVSSMGIHTHRNIAGELFVGPSQVRLTPDKKSDYSIQTPPEIFAMGLSKFIKDVKASELEPAYAGNRPKLYKNGQPIGDFQIFREGQIIHLMGIESPALTAAPAIARYVAKMITSDRANRSE